MSRRWLAIASGRRWWTVLALCYAAVVLVASLLPASGSELGATGPLGLLAVDLWLHAVGYAVLAVVVAIPIEARGRDALSAVVVAVVLYGLGVEGLQGLAPTRAPSLLDALANAVGAVVGAAVRSLLGR